MRSLLIFAAMLAMASCQPAPEPAATTEETAPVESKDSTVVDPDHYKVELENDYVRVLRVMYAAGETSAMHSHPDNVIVFLTDGAATLTPDGGAAREMEWKAGDVQWAPGESHTGVAKTDFEVLLVEIKAGPEEVQIAETNATVVDPDVHKVEFENDRVRVVRMTYPKGHKTPAHTHLPGVNVLFTDVSATNTPEGGEATDAGGTAGTVAWSQGGPPHVTENTGEAFSAIKVEVKGAS